MDEKLEMDFSLTKPVARYRTPSGPAAMAPVVLLGAGRQHAGRSVVKRRLPSFATVLVGRGRGNFWSEPTGELFVEAPALIWLFPEVEHSYGPKDEQGWDEAWILFTGSLPRDATRAGFLKPTDPVARPANPAEKQRILDRLIDEFEELSPQLAGLLVHELIATPASSIPPASDPDIDRIAETLRRNMDKPINIPALAAGAGLSSASLRRRFTARHGMSPKAYHLQTRIDRAKALLTLTDDSIEAIAAAVGFEDSYYFSRIFRSREQCSPSEFRRRHRR